MYLAEIEKADNLGAILRAFRLEPLNENELSRFFNEQTMAVRTGDQYVSPMEDLFEDSTMSGAANAHLLLGHRGCGKSTELYHLKQRIEKTGQPVWTIDFELEMNVFQANCWDIMLAITEGLCKIADQKKIKGLDKILALVSNYLRTEREIVKETDQSYGINATAGVEAQAPPILRGVLNLLATLKAELKANAVTRETIKEKMERRASEWIHYINEIAAFISDKLNGKQPVLIFEVSIQSPPENGARNRYGKAAVQLFEPPKRAGKTFCRENKLGTLRARTYPCFRIVS